MLWSLIFMRDQIDDPMSRLKRARRSIGVPSDQREPRDLLCPATPNNTRGGLPKRDSFHLIRVRALSANCRVASSFTSCASFASFTSALILAHDPEESVSLVDTRVEIENGFSPSESMTSPKLSRYTFDMSGNAQKGGLSVTPDCRPYRDRWVASSFTSCASFASFASSLFSIHLLRNKLSQLSRNQQHHQKFLDTLLICSRRRKKEASRASSALNGGN
jgi:hypothetical protein